MIKGLLQMFDRKPPRPRCPVHGEVIQTLRLKNLDPDMNGQYCGRCLAEAIAKMCHKVEGS